MLVGVTIYFKIYLLENEIWSAADEGVGLIDGW